MKFSFFLPTDEDWQETFSGGYVKVIVSNELTPEKDQIRITFCGTGKFFMAVTSGKKDPAMAMVDMFEAFFLVESIPRPVTINFLKSIGFERF
jgi:hypothetical protein